MLVKCIKDYYDLQLKKAIKVGDTLEVTEERAAALCSANNKAGYQLCEPVPTPTTEKVAKKSRAKKEA